MDFKEAMRHSLKIDKHTHTDPFLLHSQVSDLIGNDYEAKKAAEEFYRLDAKYEISKTLLASAPVRYIKRKKHYYKLKPMPIPPDNVYVYFGKDTSTLHLSGECPCLKKAARVYRSTYDRARTLNFKETYLSDRSWFYKICHLGNIARLSKFHKPRICRHCGGFTAKKATNFFYKLSAWLFDHIYIDINRKTNYTPTSFELFKAWLGKKKEKIMKLFLYTRVKKYVNTQETVSEAKLQHKFKIGYGKAAMLIDRLRADGRIVRENNTWYVLGGINTRYPDDIRVSEQPGAFEDFSEETVLELLNDDGFLSTSVIQRHLGVSYGTAAKMIDALAEKGYIKHDGQGWVKAK